MPEKLETSQRDFRDPDQSLELRIEALLSQLSLDEKCGLMLANSPGIDRLSIPAYNWWNECLHGVARAGKATVFPQAIGLAATFDADLLERIGAVISEEGRAKYNAAVAGGNRGQYRGLTFWSPNINIFRDPRWGRGQETYGEDPYLAGTLGAAFVRGLQQVEKGYLKAAACAKHFAVHSGPEGLRHEFNAVVSKKDLHETYLPAFRMLVEEGVEAVMGAYNRTNDEPCCGSSLLLEEILRDSWGFTGHVVSDCGAVHDFHAGHKITKSAEESAALAVSRGCDLNCGTTYTALAKAVADGLVSEQTVDCSVRRLLSARFRLGMFDPPDRVPFTSITTDQIRALRHIELAREAAEKSIVLLKNNGVLPIRRDEAPKTLYILGHNAASNDVLLGNYYGVSDRLVTIVEGLAAAAPEHYTVEYRLGTVVDRENENPVDWVSPTEFDHYDVVIAVLGLSPAIEGEEGEAILSRDRGDRSTIDLPEHQIARLRKMKAAGLPLVVILAGGSPVAGEEILELADALLYMWYPGEQGGNAVARVLFGDIAPSGKLPITFPKSIEQLPPFEDYSMEGRTYRFMKDEPLFPFGFGLSYTTFAYSDGRVVADSNHPEGERSQFGAGDAVTVTATVTNTGSVGASEVVQFYITDVDGSARTPASSLFGMTRIFVPAGKSVEVKRTIHPRAMALVQDDGTSVIEPGMFRVTIGSCSPGQRGRELGAAHPAIVEFELVGK